MIVVRDSDKEGLIHGNKARPGRYNLLPELFRSALVGLFALLEVE